MIHIPPHPSGCSVLAWLLREHNQDIRRLDAAGFQRWLEAHLAHWRKNPIFQQRTRIRELYRQHPELCQLERAYRQTRQRLAATPAFAHLAQLEQLLANSHKAQAGLAQAQAAATGERRTQLELKLALFQSRHHALQEEYNRARLDNPVQQELIELGQQVQAERNRLGIEQEEQQLAELLRHQGQSTGRSGDRFETLALNLTTDQLLPRIQAEQSPPIDPAHIKVLTGARLGSGPVEFDQLVVRVPADGGAVDVLAAVEVKRNLNDLARGFRQRQENLAWLTGDRGGYESERYRNRNFPSGHFDRSARHDHEGKSLTFDASSFARFQRDPDTGLFLDRLLFISRPMTLWGLSSAALSRVSHRVATDLAWQPEDPDYLARLRHWCQSLADPLETADVLGLYGTNPARAEQILLIGRGPL